MSTNGPSTPHTPGPSLWPIGFAIGVLVVTLVLTFLLYLLFQRTKLGLSMRAVASNPESRACCSGWYSAGSSR